MGAIEPKPEQGSDRFGTASQVSKEAANTVTPTPKPWSFSQPVLLKKTNRNRNVLVWSLVGSVAFAGVWSMELIATVMATNYALKVGWEALLTPVTYRIVGFLKRAEGVDVYDKDTDFTPFSVER